MRKTLLSRTVLATDRGSWQMFTPVLFIDRPRPLQIILGGVIPAVIGVVAGVLLGVSSGAYYALGALAAVGAFVSGFEHRDGWGGADRGFFGGAIYGTALLLTHWLIGTHAKVSLGSFPPLLAVLTTIVGMLLAAAGGRLARAQRERAAAATKSI
jgi:apolipoprotein N-acyltransferase